MGLFTNILKFVIKTALHTDSYDVNDINDYDLGQPNNVQDIGQMLGSTKAILHDRQPNKILSLLRLLPLAVDDRSINWIPETPKLGYKINELVTWSQAFHNRLETLEFMYIDGVASILAQDGIVDLPLYDIEVRQGYMPYGCYLRYVDNKLVEVRYHTQVFLRNENLDNCGYPEHILAMAISTIILYTTVVMHAGVCHLYYSGDIAVRLLLDKTKERTENSDIYDALLRVFTFRNSEINNNAMDLLLSSGGLLERLFALTHNGLLELLKYTEYEAQRINNWPLDECSKLQKLFSNFTSATSDFLESLNLQQGHGNHTMLLQLIVISTLLHELVGSTIGMYFLAPHILKTKILQSEFNADTDLIESSSSYEINEIAVYFTSGATMPSLLCDSLRYCFPLQYRDRLVSYQNKLRLINKSNEDAQVDLRNLETSISL